MKKKIILAVVCPVLALAVAALGYFYLLPSAQPSDVEPETAKISSEAQPKSVFTVLPDDKVFARAENEFRWAFDVSDPEKMLNEVTDTVRAKVLSADKAYYLSEQHGLPDTPLTIEILEVYSGDLKLGEQKVFFPGGAVTGEQYLKHNSSSAEKMGLLELSQKERKEMHLEFTSEMDFDLKTNTEYVFLLFKDTEASNGEYFVYCGSYSTFTKEMKNVKTRNQLRSTRAGRAKQANKDASRQAGR